ncbi:MAG: glutamate 5-kinase [Brevinematia bacterium]
MYKLKLATGEIDIERMVIKLGTKQITDIKTINYVNISSIVGEIASLKKSINDIVLVVSGAIGIGIYEIFKGNPYMALSLSQKQAIAGVGQISLMQILKDEFKKYNIPVGQVLLTQNIFDDRKAYLNAKNTLFSMLEMGIIPVINENDSVATEEIKVGQNDTLGALVSLLIDASVYIMLTDTDGFYENYGTPERKLIKVVDDIEKYFSHAKDPENPFARGGMITKLSAAKMAVTGGIPAIIANGFRENRLHLILEGLNNGTIFLPSLKALRHKKRWILGKKPRGQIIIDDGAKNALKNNKSLLATGIKDVKGSFDYGDTVQILDLSKKEVGRGLTNYSSEQIKLIMGKKSNEIEKILGEENKYSCVIHVDNLILL